MLALIIWFCLVGFCYPLFTDVALEDWDMYFQPTKDGYGIHNPIVPAVIFLLISHTENYFSYSEWNAGIICAMPRPINSPDGNK